MRTYDIWYKDINSLGNVSTFSYFLDATSWEAAEKAIPPTHWVHGCVVAVVDEETGVRIDYDNLN